MSSELLKAGREVLKKEAQAILQVMERLGPGFDDVVSTINKCCGRVVFTGIGKSGLIAKKIASTFSSIGIPAIFLHPADSLHGDLGMIRNGDVFFIISYSGETEEVVKMLPWIKRMDVPVLVITGCPGSTIASYGDYVLDVKVEEACPYNIVPTSSTTATLALGDAIAVALMKERNFRAEDFALLHPGGSLGRRLLLKVEDLMHTGDALPMVHEDATMRHVILEVTSKRLGVSGVFNGAGELSGIITDGDLRRALERYNNMLEKKASDVMTRNPKGIQKDALAAYALKKMEEFSITSLFVFEGPADKRPVGLIHIHDLLKAKIV
ncbi:MAG TPA: KpsF/GutQ family sugar-phosphate isomerase [Syntrophorhabdales bacterium]|nr:KpsF/GutQ family sugar-phosphate isomerase [Syntrophorhabdales bacterium]